VLHLTGDTHGFHDSNSRFSNIIDNILKEGDILIILGDFGYIWEESDLKKLDTSEFTLNCFALNRMSKKNYKILFIDGNHENFTLLNQLEEIEMFGAKVGKVNDNVFHLKRGNIYTIEGKTFFCFGGAKSQDRHLRVLNISWWEEELPSYKEELFGIANLEKHNNKVDYILTHSAPNSVIKNHFKLYPIDDPSIKFHERTLENIQFKHWYFGHYHLNETHNKFTCLYDDVIQLNY